LNSNLVVGRNRIVDGTTKLTNMTILHPTKSKTTRLDGAGAVSLRKRFG